jgi:Na+-translocating ferredoxin:NAD+ oxidoreductase RNF subunit RnfB
VNSRELLKQLIKAYKEDNFEGKVNDILAENPDNRLYTAKVISILSGTLIEYSSQTFIQDLKNAIKNYSTSTKIVTRVKECTMDCDMKEGKTPCQLSCAFEAIFTDCNNHTTYMDNEICTDCGFCIEACPNNNYMDKCEALPLIHELR